MWNSDFYAARPHRVGSPSSSTAPTPPPKEVLSADLARPISVRELAQSRVPAVPPPRASTSSFSSGNSSGATYLNGAHLPPSPRTSGDFAGFGVPRAPVVYAATSGVLPNWAPTARTTVTVPPAELSTYGEASDLASLAERHIDRFSHDDLYNYASHLQDTAKRYSNNLSEAYTARNMYREQVAQLKQELQQKTLQVDLQRRDRERCDAAVQKLREDNTQLRLQLAEAEGQTRNIAARLSLQNGADPSVVIRAYQAQLAQRDAQLRELTERLACESSVAEARQGSGDGDGEADTRPSRALGAAESNDDRLQRQQQLREEEIKAATAQTVAAATAELQAELNDLQQRKAALERQLTAQETAHAAALARCAAERTELQVTIERARQEQAEMQENEDALIAALAQRAPVSKANFEALQTSFAETQAALTKAEAAVATLQEQQRTVAAQEGYVEVLQQALATGQAERQELTDQNRQLQSLVDNLQREVELADTANQLRQQQLETALQGGEQLAEQVQHAEAMHAAHMSEEIGALQERCAASEAEMQRLQSENEELHRQLQEPPVSQTATHASHLVASDMANLEREKAELAAEVETLRGARDSLVVYRDSLVNEVRELEERRQRCSAELEAAQLRNTAAQLEAEAPVSAAPPSPLDDEEDTEEHGVMLQAARQCIAALQQDLETERADHAHAEADAHAQLLALERTVAEQRAALRTAEEQRTHAEAAAQNTVVERLTNLNTMHETLMTRAAAVTAERDALRQRAAAAEEEVRTVKAALEELAGDLSSTTQRADTAAAANEALQAENAAMKTELSVARSAAASIASERDSRREDDGAAHERLEAAEARARAAATECEGMQQRLRTAEENDRTAVAALEAMAEKLSDAEARVEALTSENGALTQAKTQLTAERDDAQRRVAAAGENERTLKAAVEELAAKLAAADQHVEDLTAQTGSLEAERAQLCSERDTLRQRVSDAAEELQSVKAALEDLAAECSDTKQRADALAAQVAGLEGERLKLLAELEHAHVVLAEVEVRLADAEHRDSERTAAMEHLSAAQLAQIASLEEQTSQLKKELSTARAAISTMAEHRADTETQISDLQSQLNHASEQRKTEEKTASALRSELAVARAAVAQLADDLATHAADDTALRAAAQAQDEAVALLRTKHEEDNAELMELRRRAEELRGVLSTTLDRLAQKEELEKQLNDNAGELAANNAALTEELATLRQTLEMALAEERELLERLDAANRGVEQTASMYNERILDMDRLQGELDAVTQAFAAQTEQLKSGLTRVVGMSDGFRRAVEAAMAPAATTVRATAKLAADASSYVFEDCEGREAGAACSVSAAVAAVKAALTPWSETLDWVAATRQRIEELEGSRANAGAGHEDFSTASADGAAAATTDARSQAGEDSPASSYLSEVSQARSALLDFVEQQTTSLAHLRRLRHALHERDQAAVDKQAALEAVAGGAVDAQERADGLFRATEDARHRILQAEREWEEQLQLKSQATAAELIVARRAEERANDARTRAEAQLAAAEKELKETQAALRTTQEEKQKLALQTERLSLLSSQQSDSSALQRRRGSVGDSVTPPTAAVSTGSRTTRYTVSSSTEEAVEQTHLLQVAGLQQELVRCRRQIRELESEEATLRQAYMALEQEVSDLRSDAAEVVNLRAEMATLRADYADSEERYERLRLMVDAVGDGTAQENRRLRQELKLKDAELEEYKTRQENSLVSRGAPDFETQRLEEAFRQSMSGIATQLTAKQAEFSGGHHGGNSLSASPQDVLNSRIDHLQTLVRERDAVISKMKAADLQSRVKCEGLEEKLAEKTAALNGAEELLAQYMERLDAMRAAGLAAAVTTRATTTPQRNTGKSSRERAKRDSALPPTPLSLNVTDGSTSTSHKGATPAGLAMPSPAPRMPNLDDVAAGSGEEDEEDEVRKINGNGSEDDASATPPATSRRRTGATGENSSCGNRRTREVHSSSSGTTPPRASPKVGKTVSTRKRAR